MKKTASTKQRRELAEQLVREYFESWLRPSAEAKRFTSPGFRKGILDIYRFVLLSEGRLEPALKKVGLLKPKSPPEQIAAIRQLIQKHVGKSAKLEANSLFIKLLGSGAAFSKYLWQFQVVPGPAWLFFTWRLSKLYFALRPLKVRVDPAKVFRDLMR